MDCTSVSPPPTKRRKLSVPDLPVHSPRPDDFTVYSFNVNGIAPFVQSQPAITTFFKQTPGKTVTLPDRVSLRSVLRRCGWPTLLFLQEVKISPDDSATKRAVSRAAQPDADDAPGAPSYHVEFCLPSDKYNARGFGRKVYGVCSLIRDDFFGSHVDVVREVEWDKEGRFLVCETKATETVPRLAIFNVYAVNGTDFAYKSPVTGEVSGTRHDRKLDVQRLLQAECRSLEDRGYRIIVAGDMNIARSIIDGFPNLRTHPQQHCTNRADFERRFFAASAQATVGVKDRPEAAPQAYGLGMIDTFRELWPERKGYTYYPRGCAFGASCDRVDMIMISRSLRESLVDAGMRETPIDRATSDHVPLYATLKFGREKDDEREGREHSS